MENVAEIHRNGYRWLFGAGLVAICISVFLYSADELLTNSDSEQRLEQTLYELRTAQSSLVSGEIDPRQKNHRQLITKMTKDRSAME